MSDEDTSIKVSKATRERLAVLATEQGTTIRGLVEDLAGSRLTTAELEARGEQARAYLREEFGTEVTDTDLAAGDRLLAAMRHRTTQYRGHAA